MLCVNGQLGLVFFLHHEIEVNPKSEHAILFRSSFLMSSKILKIRVTATLVKYTVSLSRLPSLIQQHVDDA